tara:strand:+ start:2873 stop:3682 length:810 start_codon:yes stop_codon:yes gene_type:complete
MNNISVDTNDLYLIDEENKDYISEENKNDLSEENFSKEIISQNKNDLSEENKKLLNEKIYLSKREKQLLEEINNLTKEINELSQKEEENKKIIDSLKLNIFLSDYLTNKKNDNDTDFKSIDESIISKSISTNTDTDTDIISCDLIRSESDDSYLKIKHNSFNTVSNNTFTKNNLQYLSFNYLSKNKDYPPLNYKFYVRENSYYNIDEFIKVRGKFIEINNSNITASFIKNNSIRLIRLDSERFYNLNKSCIQKAFKSLNFRNYNINPNF